MFIPEWIFYYISTEVLHCPVRRSVSPILIGVYFALESMHYSKYPSRAPALICMSWLINSQGIHALCNGYIESCRGAPWVCGRKLRPWLKCRTCGAPADRPVIQGPCNDHMDRYNELPCGEVESRAPGCSRGWLSRSWSAEIIGYRLEIILRRRWLRRVTSVKSSRFIIIICFC